MPTNNLDTLVQEEGTEFNENSLNILKKEIIQEKLNNSFIYEDSKTPIPGENINNDLDNQLNNITKETALDSLITKSAIIKAEQEKEKEKPKLTKEEKEKIKKQFIEEMLYQQGEAYFQEHHYIMDGKTKKRTRKIIEKAYDKGKFKKYMQPNSAANLNN